MRDIKIALRKTSLVDYPGKVAAVLFFCGCNLRCPWCYNWELVTASPGNSTDSTDLTSLGEAFALIEKRRHLLGGVVLSGGEPTLIKELPEIIAGIKKRGLPVKLDTNGMRPAVLKKICGSKDTAPDFIAMDIKLPPERYAELTMQKADSPEQAAETAEKIRESIAFIRESGIEHEFRALTLPAPYFSEKDMSDIKALADDTLKIRAFRGGNCLDETWNQYPSSS